MLEALKTHGAALDASDVGTGKSISFLHLCKLAGARPAIVTKKTIVPAWVHLCKEMGLSPMFVTNYEQLLSDKFEYCVTKPVTKKTGDKLYTSKAFVKWEIPEKRVVFCFDEAQALRSPTSFASKAAFGASRQFKTVLLSATPFETPLDAQMIGKILKLINQGGEFRWLLRHGVRKNLFGHMEFIGNRTNKHNPELVALYQEQGREIMEKINADIFPSRGVRTRRTEIPGFPESKVEFLEVETGCADEITKLYLKELAELRERDHERAAEGVDEEFKHLVDVLPVVVNLRIRQEIELMKLSAIAEMAKDAAAQGEKVAVFLNFDASISVLAKLLKTTAIIRGAGEAKGDRPRNAVIYEFQQNREPYVLVNSMAGGAGLSLHDAADRVPRTSIISPPFRAIQMRQIFGRVWRRGGGFATQKVVFASGTLEEKMLGTLRALDGNLDALLDSHLDIRNYG